VCKHRVEPDWIRAKVEKGEVARCPRSKCKSGKKGESGLVKPDIVFFGESLPTRFFRCIPDLKTADLLIVMGTSLQVQPFASLIDAVPATCPRVLLNLERVGELASSDGYEGGGMGAGMYNETGFDFDGLTYGGKDKTRDVFWEGKADDAVAELVKHLGEEWETELKRLKEEGYAKLDKGKKQDMTASVEATTVKDKKTGSKKEEAVTKATNVKNETKELANPTIKDDSSKLDELTRDLESKAKLDDKPATSDESSPAKKSS